MPGVFTVLDFDKVDRSLVWCKLVWLANPGLSLFWLLLMLSAAFVLEGLHRLSLTSYTFVVWLLLFLFWVRGTTANSTVSIMLTTKHRT